MSTQDEQTPAGISRRFALGAFASIAYVLIFVVYALNQHNAMLAMKPDQFAEFLGGVFAPLAFLWLVLGYWQQGDELRSGSEALRLQEEELHNLLEQQTALVTVAREQFQHEKSRAEAAEKESRRLAQPTLVLKGGTSRTSAGSPGKLVREFTLENVGATCTQVAVDFAGLRDTARFASLTNGDERNFELTFDLGDFSPVTIVVQYTDARGERGEKAFVLRKRGDNVLVVHDDGRRTFPGD